MGTNTKDLHVQRVVYANMNAMWAAVHPGYNLANIQQNAALAELYDDAAAQLPNCDFQQVAGASPAAGVAPAGAPQPFYIRWDTPAAGTDPDYFAGAIIHELAHAAVSQQYARHGVNQGEDVWANVHLPPAGAAAPGAGGAGAPAQHQLDAMERQSATIIANWGDLRLVAAGDPALPHAALAHVQGRIDRGETQPLVHNDTVIGDILYYLLAKNLQHSSTYRFAVRMLGEANNRRRNPAQGVEARRVDRQARWYELWKW